MKNIFKIVTFTTALTLVTTVAKANENIGFADANYLFQSHPLILAEEAKMAKLMEENQKNFSAEEKNLAAEGNKLQSDAKKLEQEMQSVESSLKKKIAALEKDAPRLRAREIQARQQLIENEQKLFQNKVVAFQKREDEFKKKVSMFQAKVEKINRELSTNTYSADVQKQVVEQINSIIKEVAQEKGYTMVVSTSSILYTADESRDTTNEVFQRLKSKNAGIVVTSPEVVAEPESPKAEEAKPAEAKQ